MSRYQKEFIALVLFKPEMRIAEVSFSEKGGSSCIYMGKIIKKDEKTLLNDDLGEFVNYIEKTDDILKIFKVDSYISLDCNYKELFNWHKSNNEEYYCQDSLQTFEDLIFEFNKISVAA
jgi:hypothetical protein